MTSYRKIAVAIALPMWLATSLPLSSVAIATIQDDQICWDPDVETPTSCDEDDD